MNSGQGYLEWNSGRTWYNVIGDLNGAAGLTPIVISHGGPGAGSDYCEPIANLSRDGRACILYDQIGCGRSQHMPDADPSFWTVQLFKDELVALLEHLGIGDNYILLGQSWGGMLAMEHALDHPAGMRALIICDSPASMPLWVAECDRLRGLLPQAVQKTLTSHESAGTTDDPAYRAAERAFYDQYLCRIPWPDCLVRSQDQQDADPTVYFTMNGPSEFHVTGTLKNWDITDRLVEIDVPTLLVSGRHDEATPLIVEQIHRRIPQADWIIFEESSHLPHVEEPDAFLDRVGAFLHRLPTTSTPNVVAPSDS